MWNTPDSDPPVGQGKQTLQTVGNGDRIRTGSLDEVGNELTVPEVQPLLDIWVEIFISMSVPGTSLFILSEK